MTDPRAGHPQVGAALDTLATLDQVPVEQHVAAYEAIQAALRSALAGDTDPA